MVIQSVDCRSDPTADAIYRCEGGYYDAEAAEEAEVRNSQYLRDTIRLDGARGTGLLPAGATGADLRALLGPAWREMATTLLSYSLLPVPPNCWFPVFLTATQLALNCSFPCWARA